MADSVTSLVKLDESDIRSRILPVRKVQVILDRDLAELYGVETRILNQAVRRNAERFPSDFMFQLTKEECVEAGVISAVEAHGKHLKYMPYAFTENGVAMLSGVLHSPTAIEVNIRIIRAFVAMRHFMLSNAAVLQRLETVEVKQVTMDHKLNQVLDAMQDKKFPPQKIFFDGQFYDAFVWLKKYIRMARKELIVIDPYFAASVLPQIAQKRDGVSVVIVQCKRGKKLLPDVDVRMFNAQYRNSLTVKESERFHDRYFIIDRKTLVHIGASLNYFGKKCFACSTFDPIDIPEMLAKLQI